MAHPNDKGAGLHHPTIPSGPLTPFNERTRLKLLMSNARIKRYRQIERVDRELAKMAAR